jgi:hypothetical protein
MIPTPTTSSEKSWLSEGPTGSCPTIRWRLLMRAPNGLPQTIELRAPSEAIALDRAAHWRPEWTVLSIERSH